MHTFKNICNVLQKEETFINTLNIETFPSAESGTNT